MSTLGAKFKLDELEDARNSSGDMSYGDVESGNGGGGGRSLVGGEGMGGSCKREDDAFLTSTSGRLDAGETGESGLVAVDVLLERVKMTGDGDGSSGDGGAMELDGFRRICSGGTGLSVGLGAARGSDSPIVVPLGRARAGVDRFRARCDDELGTDGWGGSLSRLRYSACTTVVFEELDPDGVFVRRTLCDCADVDGERPICCAPAPRERSWTDRLQGSVNVYPTPKGPHGYVPGGWRPRERAHG